MEEVAKIFQRLKKSAEKKVSVADYLELSNTWETNYLLELNDRVTKSETRQKIVLAIALAAVLGLIYMAATEKHFIQIEEIDVRTGYRKIRDLYQVGEPLTITQQELFLKADVRRFIECYEGYALSQRQENLTCIGAFSSKSVLNQYKLFVNKDNASGPASIIRTLGLVKVNIVDITPLTQDKNTVISHVVLKPETDKEYEPIPTVITLTYEYKEVPAKAKIRELNPHGFMVKSYYSNAQD